MSQTAECYNFRRIEQPNLGVDGGIAPAYWYKAYSIRAASSPEREQ